MSKHYFSCSINQIVDMICAIKFKLGCKSHDIYLELQMTFRSS